MGESILVTAGTGLTVWEAQNCSSIYTYTPEKSTVGVQSSVFSTSWSADTTGLASIIKGENKVLLTFNKNGKYATHEIATQGISNPSFAQFPRTSQKHLYISSGSELHVFDMARHKSRKSFALKNDISCFVANHSDSYLAIGCDNGSILLLNTATNQLSQPFTAPLCSGQRVTCVKYSPRRTGVLGSACESGTVSFWDCHANKNLFNLNEHLAPCTSFAFSPVNDALAASCGLDKKLICHDTKSRKSVFTLALDQPCTCLDFEMDGTTVAVGTSRGKVNVYDLRNPSLSCQSFTAHSGKVSALLYKPRVDKQNVSQVMSAVKLPSKSKLRSQKSLGALKTVEEEIKENVKPDFNASPGNPAKKMEVEEKFSEAAAEVFDSPRVSDSSIMSRRDSLSSQLFSPLKENDASFNTPNLSSRDSSRRGSDVRLSTEGLFSPLRDETATPLSLAGGGGGRRTPYTTTPVMSPLTSIQEENVNVEEMASVEDKHSGLTSKNVAGYNAVKAVNGAAGHATSTPAQAVLASFGSDQAPAPLPPTTINKPFLRSSAFESKSVGMRGSEKLSLNTLNQVARSLTGGGGESSPEFETKQARAEENTERRRSEFLMADEDASSSLAVPLGSNRCRIRDEDRNKSSPLSQQQRTTPQPRTHFPFNATSQMTTERENKSTAGDDDAVKARMEPQHQQLAAVDSFSAESEQLGREMHSVLTAFPWVSLQDSNSSAPDSSAPATTTASDPQPRPEKQGSFSHQPFQTLSSTTALPLRQNRAGGGGGALSSSGASLESSEAGAFNRRFVEEVVSSAMEEWAASVENRITNMHYSLIRILQQHQEETREYIDQLSGMNQLRRQNEMLQQENENLKRFF